MSETDDVNIKTPYKRNWKIDFLLICCHQINFEKNI